MKKALKIFFVVTVVMLSLFALSIASSAADTFEWDLSEDGVLTISGNGEMGNRAANDWPWYKNNNKIKEIIIEDGITSVGSLAFFNCDNLTSVKMPGSVQIIYHGAFAGCDWLIEIEIPEGVTIIAESAFDACTRLKKVTLPYTLIYIEKMAFMDCPYLQNVYFTGMLSEFKKVVIDVGNDYLYGAKIEFLATGYTWSLSNDGVLEIGGSGLMERKNTETKWPWDDKTNKIKTIIIGDEIRNVSEKAFLNCDNLTEVKLGKKVKEISSQAFANCEALESISFPEGLEIIDTSAFSNCSALKTVTIPASVLEIRRNAFKYCEAINNVNYTGSSEEWEEISIETGNEELTNEDIVYSFVPTYTGDINGDGDITSTDVIVMSRALANWSGYEAPGAALADVNNDGIVTATDMIIMSRYIAKWQGYDTLPYIA